MWAVAVAAVAAYLSTFAASITTVEDLNTACRGAIQLEQFPDAVESRNISKGTACMRYIQSVLDSISMHKALGGDAPICLPDAVTPAEIIMVFTEWADEHSDQAEASARVSIFAVLKQTYPCDQKPAN